MFQPGSGNEAFRARIKPEWRKRSGYLSPVPINRTLTLTTPWSRSTLLHQRGSALTHLLKRHFQITKFLRTQFREHALHLPGMLSKGSSNEGRAACGEGDDPHAPVLGALDPAHQALLHETVHGDTDRTCGQIDDRAYRIDGQRPLVQQDFQHAEIREAEPGLFNTSGCIPR